MTSERLREQARRWLAEQRRAVLVEVLRTRGSVPRAAGARMLVAADDVHGTIGGGHLEWQAIASARRLLAGQPERAEQRLALGPALGQCCGGVVTLRLQSLVEAHVDGWPPTEPRFTLHLHGAGHVGRAIARLLHDLPCRAVWIDERDDAFPAARGGTVEQRCVDSAAAEVAAAPPGCCFLVLTHSHALDLEICAAVLRRGDFAFLGLIGSATKRARFVHRLQARGIADGALQRLTCPIGVPGISGKEPEVIAVAAVAQLLGIGVPMPR